MPTNTTNQQITVPIGTDAADNPQAFLDQIADVENRLVQRYTNLADRTARNPAPTQGELSILNTSTWYDRYTGTKWIPVTPIQVYKTADQSVNNSVTLVNDAELVVPLPVANTTYAIELMAIYNTGTTGDIKFTFIGPAGSVTTFGGVGLATTAAAASGDGNFAATLAPATLSYGGAGVGAGLTAHIHGTITLAGTTGNLQVQWAQATLEVANTTVNVRSRLSVWAIS